MDEVKEIVVISEETVHNRIYTIRGYKVMLDFELAEIYGYTTTRFNEQVKNNIEKFDDDFMFELTKEEFENLISKKSTSSWGGRRKLPKAFTEQGIYMLMTVLRGELAIKQSKTLVRTFKKMKDYILDNRELIGQREYIQISMQTAENVRDISKLQSEMGSIEKQMCDVMDQLEDVVTKSDLAEMMDSFVDNEDNGWLMFNTKYCTADLAYSQVYGQAKNTIFVVDNYIGLRTLVLLKNASASVVITLFSDNMQDGSVVLAIVGVLMLIAGYIWSAAMNVNVGGFELIKPALGILILISVGTYLLFCNMIPLLIVWIKKNRGFYFKISNFISTSQISFRMKGNARILSVSALLCAITITMISSSYSLYRGLQDLVDFYAPYSYIAKDITDEQHEELLEAAEEIGEVKITQDDKVELINAHMEDEAYKPDVEKYEREDNSAVYLLSESQYLTIISHTNAKYGTYSNLNTDFKGGLLNGECYFIDANPVPDYCREMPGSDMTITFKDKKEQYKVVGSNIHKYLGMVDGFKKSSLVLSDTEYEDYWKIAGSDDMSVFYGIMFDDEMLSKTTSDRFDMIVEQRFFDSKMPANISYISFYHSSFALYGAYVFIGVFIGILFLMAVGSIMYYKMIMEAEEEKFRYEILRKTGMNQQEISSSIRKQLGLTYLLPLLVGLVHTVFALLTYNRTLENLGQETPTLLNAAMVVGCYLVFYGFFYLLSVCHYKSIVE